MKSAVNKHSIVILPLALLLLGWSGLTLIVDSFVAAPYREIAERLERGRVNVPEGTYLKELERTLGVDRVWQLCSRDIVRSAVTVKLAALDSTYRRQDTPASREQALQDAEATLKDALRCRPADGNFWLRLAIVRLAAERTASAPEKQLAMSLAASPSEAWIMRSRFAFAAGIGESRSPAVVSVLRTDARNLVAHGRATEVANLYLAANASARALLDEEMTHMSTGRHQELVTAIREAAERAEDARNSSRN